MTSTLMSYHPHDHGGKGVSDIEYLEESPWKYYQVFLNIYYPRHCAKHSAYIILLEPKHNFIR